MLNIRRVLDDKRIPVKACASFLEISEKTFFNKAMGTSDFTYKEICRLRELLPEYNIDYLLAEDPGNPMA